MKFSDMDATFLLFVLMLLGNVVLAPAIFLIELGLALGHRTRRYAIPLALGVLGGAICAATWSSLPFQFPLLAFTLIAGPGGVYCAVSRPKVKRLGG